MTLVELADAGRLLADAFPTEVFALQERFIKNLKRSGRPLAPLINRIYKHGHRLNPCELFEHHGDAVRIAVKGVDDDAWLAPEDMVDSLTGAIFTLRSTHAIYLALLQGERK